MARPPTQVTLVIGLSPEDFRADYAWHSSSSALWAASLVPYSGIRSSVAVAEEYWLSLPELALHRGTVSQRGHILSLDRLPTSLSVFLLNTKLLPLAGVSKILSC